jgi:hypothetical protein
MERITYCFVLEHQGISYLRYKHGRGIKWATFDFVKYVKHAYITHYESVAKRQVENYLKKWPKTSTPPHCYYTTIEEVGVMLAEHKLSQI